MTRSGNRTVLVALGVVAVALGSALFPPTGLGSAPASETDLVGSGPSGSGNGQGPGSGGDQGPDSGTGSSPESTSGASVVTGAGETAGTDDADSDRGTADATPAAATASSESTTATPTPTPTSTPNATATSGIDGSDDEGGLDWTSVLGVLTLFFVGTLALAAVGSLLRAFLQGGSSSGSSQSPGLFGAFGWLFGGSLTGMATRIPQATMVALVGVSTGTARVLGTAGSLAGEAVGGLGLVVTAGTRSVAAGFGSGLSGLFSLPSGPTLSFPSLFSGVGSGGSSAATGDSPTADARTTAPLDPGSDDEEPIRTVEDAWEAFADPLPADDPEARTPGEFARLAVERGDPSGPVRRLTRLFREVRYGGQPPSDDRTRSAIDAVGDILADRDREGDR